MIKTELEKYLPLSPHFPVSFGQGLKKDKFSAGVTNKYSLHCQVSQYLVTCRAKISQEIFLRNLNKLALELGPPESCLLLIYSPTCQVSYFRCILADRYRKSGMLVSVGRPLWPIPKYLNNYWMDQLMTDD